MATDDKTTKTIGNTDTKSRAKSKTSAERTEMLNETVDSEAWPRGSSGQPMMKITMTASELIPVGQYANVSIGPAQITAFIEADRVIENESSYFSEDERAGIAQALNELAEIVEGDVVAVQRSLVLESMQNQVTANGSK